LPLVLGDFDLALGHLDHLLGQRLLRHDQGEDRAEEGRAGQQICRRDPQRGGRAARQIRAIRVVREVSGPLKWVPK
jgi:hypothetical protein